jgi:hypothetical protein
MVLFKTAIFGTALLVLGVLVLSVFGQYVTMEVQQSQRHDLDTSVEFLVGDMVDRTYTLPSNVAVFGTINVAEAPSNKSGDIRFIVFDAENFQRWSSSGQANSAFSATEQGTSNYTFTNDKAGSYHFVFDNRASLFKKYVTLSVSYNEVITSTVPDPRTNYVAWAFLIGGALILVYGLARKPPVQWA